MTHPASVKGAALARLVTGETPGAVSRATGLPYATVKRWQGEALGRNGHQKNYPSFARSSADPGIAGALA
jgi:hypothetical protein